MVGVDGPMKALSMHIQNQLNYIKAPRMYHQSVQRGKWMNEQTDGQTHFKSILRLTLGDNKTVGGDTLTRYLLSMTYIQFHTN